MAIEHFGIKLKLPEDELRLSRDNYIQYHKDGSPILSFGPMGEEALRKQIDRCMFNFDLNMQFFSELDEGSFIEELDSFLESHPSFKKVDDLNLYKDLPGTYLMVLDEYKQAYLGGTNSLKRRIQRHWTYKKPLDRLIFGTVVDSKLSIDSFRALDTTRLYIHAISEEQVFAEEREVTRIEDRYLLNRTATGLLSGGLKEALEKRVPRDLLSIGELWLLDYEVQKE